MTSTQQLFFILSLVSWGLNFLEWVLAYFFVAASYRIGVPVYRETVFLEHPPVRHSSGSTISRPEGRFRFLGSSSVLFTTTFHFRGVIETQRPYPLKCIGTLRNRRQIDVIAKVPVGLILFPLFLVALLLSSPLNSVWDVVSWCAILLVVGAVVVLSCRWRAQSLTLALKDVLKPQEEGLGQDWETGQTSMEIDVSAARSTRRRIPSAGVVGLSVLIGLSLVLEGTPPKEREAALQKGSSTVIGRVTAAKTRTEYRKGPDFSTYRILDYSYTVADLTIRGSFRSVDASLFRYEPGDTITIRYATADPSVARPACLDGPNDSWLMVIIGWIFLGIAAGFPVLNRFVLSHR